VFEGLVTARGRCDHCGKPRQVAYIPPEPDAQPFGVAYAGELLKLCAHCIYRLQATARLLLQLEGAHPKKTRKRRLGHPRAIAGPLHPPKHEVSSLVPASEEVSA
jgi:hypothetical protein